MRRYASALLTVACLAAACSGTESTTIEETAGTQADDAAGNDEEAVSPLSPEEWSTAMTATWSDLLAGRSRSASIAIEGMTTGDHRLDWTQNFLTEERMVLRQTLENLPGDPAVPSLVEPYQGVVSSLEALLAESDVLYDLGQADPDTVRADLDAAGDDLPASEYGALYIALSELDAPLTDACFTLQSAMTDEGLGLLDCTGSGVDHDEAQEGVGTDDPTKEPTGGAVDVRLDPGLHDFSVFGPGLLVETTEPLTVATTNGSILFGTIDESDVDFLIIDTQNVVDPASFGDGRAFTDAAYGPLKTDVGTWLAALPLTIVGSGTISVGDVEYPYWDVGFDPEAGVEELLFAVWNGTLDDGGAADALVLLPIPGVTTRIVEWDRSNDRLLASWFVEGDDGAAYEELFVQVMTGVRQP